jgi:hypothetical protein
MIGSEEDPKDRQSGFDAGRAGKPFVYPPDVKDLFGWTSGYIEEKHVRSDRGGQKLG